MIVVSNAGPLIALARIHHLSLLQSLYDGILIPTAVQREVGLHANLPGAMEVRSAQWIKVAQVSDQIAVSLLRERLDSGESEAIVLTLEQQADLLLMDKARGRRIAQSRGLAHIGTVGILVIAKRRGFIDTVTPILEQLIASGFRMDEVLFLKARHLAGES